MVIHTIKDHKKLLEARFDLRGVEFVNSEMTGLECQHSSTLTDNLAMLLEVYKIPVSLSLRGNVRGISTGERQ